MTHVLHAASATAAIPMTFAVRRRPNQANAPAAANGQVPIKERNCKQNRQMGVSVMGRSPYRPTATQNDPKTTSAKANQAQAAARSRDDDGIVISPGLTTIVKLWFMRCRDEAIRSRK
jgi:hypothetical protein